MAVRRDPKKSHRHEGAAKAACTKACKSGDATDAEEIDNDADTELVDDDDDDDSDPVMGGLAGAVIGGVAGLVIGGVLGAMAEAFKSAVDDDDAEDFDDEGEGDEEDEGDEAEVEDEGEEE